MKTKIVGVVAAVMLSACNMPYKQAQEAQQRKIALIQEYSALGTAQVRAGQMKRSDYYAGLYERAQQPPVSQMDIAAMRGASVMIDTAKQYEAGQITMDAYQSRLREVNISMNETGSALEQQAAAQDQARRNAALQYYLQTRPVTTTCFGNSCTSR